MQSSETTSRAAARYPAHPRNDDHDGNESDDKGNPEAAGQEAVTVVDGTRRIWGHFRHSSDSERTYYKDRLASAPGCQSSNLEEPEARLSAQASTANCRKGVGD